MRLHMQRAYSLTTSSTSRLATAAWRALPSMAIGCFIAASVQAQNLTWVRTGGPLGGLGYDIRIRPDNPDSMYVSDAFAGVFKSTNGGQTWTPANTGITARTGASGDAIPVFCLTIDPHNPDTLWCGTQNMRGIFRSTNGGGTWTEMDNGVIEDNGITFRGITVDPQSHDTIYAAAELSSWAWAGEERPGREFDLVKGVVYKTTDGGANWQAVWRGDNLARYVWVSPADSNVVYVSTGIFDREAANSDPAARLPGGEGVVKSIDGGDTWTSVNNGLNNLYVGSLFMHPEDPDILLAGTGHNQYYENAGVYLTTDGGASWTQVLAGHNIESVEFCTTDPDIAYAAGDSAVFRSENGGLTWTLMAGGPDGWGPDGVRAGFPIDFQVDPRDSGRLFVNNYGGGNFLTTNGGTSWSVASKGYTGAQVRDIAVDPSEPGRVYAAARSGIFRSINAGADWRGLNHAPQNTLEWYVVAVNPADPQYVLAANNWNGVLLRSSDYGHDWAEVSSRVASNMAWRAITFAPSSPTTVYAGSAAFFSAGTFSNTIEAAGVYVSLNGGATWGEANDSNSQDANVAALAVAYDDPQRVYAATCTHGMLKSTNGGSSWSAINQGLPGSPPTTLSVAVHPQDHDVVYVGIEGGGLHRSVDGGQSWEHLASGIEANAFLSDIVFDPAVPQTIYAADRATGVYQSTDGGDTWTLIDDGLRTRDINALAISADGRHLYASSEGEGVFRLDLSGTAPVTAPDPENDGTTGGNDDDGTDGNDNGGNAGAAGCGEGAGVIMLGIPVLLLLRRTRRY